MKEYKVGDTIYVKGKVKAIDNTALPYCVDFGNGNNFMDFESGTVWVTSDNMIDELPTAEPVKPVLPKDVADELEYAKNHRHCNFFGYLRAASSDATSLDCPAATRFLDGFRGEKIKILSDAWYNGYTVSKEKKYNVKVPHAVISYFKKTDANYCIAGDTFYVDLDEDLAQFTEADIEKYGLQDCEKVEVTDDGTK